LVSDNPKSTAKSIYEKRWSQDGDVNNFYSRRTDRTPHHYCIINGPGSRFAPPEKPSDIIIVTTKQGAPWTTRMSIAQRKRKRKRKRKEIKQTVTVNLMSKEKNQK